MCRQCNRNYECFVSPEEQNFIWKSYISSITPNWVMDPFPLERLPRELRDGIYDKALVHEEYAITSKVQSKTPCKDRSTVAGAAGAGAGAQQSNNNAMDVDGEDNLSQLEHLPLGLSATVRYRAPTNALLACRWMRKECEERAAGWKTLVLKDSDLYNFHHIILPEQVTGVLFLELYLILFCHSCPFMNHEGEGSCRATAEIARHKSWIGDMLQQLSCLRSFSIFVHLAHSDFVPGQKTKLPCEDLVECKLRELTALPRLKELVLYRYKFDEHQNFDGSKDLVSRWKPESAERFDRASLT